jgi:hypothetical protein
LKETFPNSSIAGAWQVAVVDGNEFIGRIYIATDVGGSRFSGFTADPLVGRLMDAVAFARSSGAGVREGYEIREYSDISMGFHSLWLHSKSVDLMVPLVLPNAVTPKFQVRSVNEVQGLLRARVEYLIHDIIYSEDDIRFRY